MAINVNELGRLQYKCKTYTPRYYDNIPSYNITGINFTYVKGKVQKLLILMEKSFGYRNIKNNLFENAHMHQTYGLRWKKVVTILKVSNL